MPVLQRRSYNKFILPVERTDYTSIDYFRGMMFVCTGFKIYRVNPTTNILMGSTDIEVTNPIVDIDVENQGTFLAICLGEKKIKRIDAYTGKVISEIIVDRFDEGEMTPFTSFSTVTKAPNGFYLIDGYFNQTLSTNRIIRYDPVSQVSFIVNEVSAANNNDLEFDDIGLLRLTDVKGVIERYNIISGSSNFGKQIDEIPVGDPYPLRVDEIVVPDSPLQTSQISPPDITYFEEQRFAFLTLEPNWEFKNCPDPKEWQIALNPCIPQEEQNINFIQNYNNPDNLISFVNSIDVESDHLTIELDNSYNYSSIVLYLTDSSGRVKGSTTYPSTSSASFTLQNQLGDRSLSNPEFVIDRQYHLEVIVKFNEEAESEYHSFNFDFQVNSFPTIFSPPFSQPMTSSTSYVDNSVVSPYYNPNNFIELSKTVQYYDNTTSTTSSVSINYKKLFKDLKEPESGTFELILDAMEDEQRDILEKEEEIIFLKSEKDNLLYTKNLIVRINELNEERTILLRDHDTTQFPYTYNLQHIDKALNELNAITGINTLELVNSRIDFINSKITILKNYIEKLEEKLRFAELECNSPRIFCETIDSSASEVQNPIYDGQTVFSLINATYNPGSGDLLVYVNGVLQIVNIDYNETNPTEITFINNSLITTDEIIFVLNPTISRLNVVIPAVGDSVAVFDPIINHVDFPENIMAGVGVQSPIHEELFKVYDAFDRQINLTDLDRFYFSIDDENIVELRIDNNNYYIFGIVDGETKLNLHIADTIFSVPLLCQTGITPLSIFSPLCICPPKEEDKTDLFKLVLENNGSYINEDKLIFKKDKESHLVIDSISDTGHRQVNPGKCALMFEGTMIFPDTYHEGMIIEYAQEDQSFQDTGTDFSLILDYTLEPEKPIILEGALDTDIIIPSEVNLKLSPTAFNSDLILEESLEFDPTDPLKNPLVIQQGVIEPGQGGSLQMQFICDDTPADDSENTILLQGNNGGRHPVKITWDGDYCYVLYEGECSADLIDLKSIFRKVFISSPDIEIYGLGLHSTSVFAQARDVEGQEFALVKTEGKAISFINTFQEYENAQNPDAALDLPKITVNTSGLIYGPDTLALNTGVIFNHHYQSGISLEPGQSLTISFNTFRMIEGLTFIAQTDNPIQEIIMQSSRDGANFLENDRAVINKTSLSVYELNQLREGVKTSDYITNIRFVASEDNTSQVNISLINLFTDKDKFNRSQIPIQQIGTNSKALVVANQLDNTNADFTFSPNPLDFLNQTIAAPINPLKQNILTNVLESSSLVVSGLPSSGILPVIFSEDSEIGAIAPISPITDIRGNSELIYRSGVMGSFENLVPNGDWKWGMLNWNIVNKPFVQFKSLLSDTLSNQAIISREPSEQGLLSGISSEHILVLPDTDYHISFQGIDLTESNLGFIRLDYYDIKQDFISSSAPIHIKDTNTLLSIKKRTPEYTNTIKITIGIDKRTIGNFSSATDLIKVDWIALTKERITDFIPYDDNIDIVKIKIET